MMLQKICLIVVSIGRETAFVCMFWAIFLAMKDKIKFYFAVYNPNQREIFTHKWVVRPDIMLIMGLSVFVNLHSFTKS